MLPPNMTPQIVKTSPLVIRGTTSRDRTAVPLCISTSWYHVVDALLVSLEVVLSRESTLHGAAIGGTFERPSVLMSVLPSVISA